METLLTLFSGILALFVVGAALLLTTMWMTRRRALRTAEQFDPSELEAVREDLLEVVKESSKRNGDRVVLEAFWRDRSIERTKRHAVLEPLLRRRILSASKDADGVMAFFQFLSWDILNRPAGVVVLSELDWMRMATGAPASVVVGTVHGTLVGSVSGGIVQTGAGSSAQIVNEVTPEILAALISALRTDAATLPQTDREHAESLADSLEMDAKRNRWSRILDTVNSITGVMANSGSMWASTADILARM